MVSSKGVAIGVFLKYLALILICLQAFSIRLFSVVKYESVIHEVSGAASAPGPGRRLRDAMAPFFGPIALGGAPLGLGPR
jgi:hypothetical protein